MKLLKLTPWLFLIFFSLNADAQTPDTSTTQKLLQYIFQNVDKSQVPTGYLEEYGCPILPMETFNGSLSDSNRIDMNLWRTLYFQLQTGYCQSGANPLPAITAINSVIKQNAASGSATPIPLLLAQYNAVRSDAFSNNLLSYNSSTKQVYDVTGRSQSPYQLNNLFAACPNKKQTIYGIDSFVCKSNMVWNNTGKSISQIQIDFANGLGFKNITLDAPFIVSYADTGYKRWTVKITLSDNSVLQCYSDYYVLKASTSNQRFGDNPIVTPTWGYINVNSGATVSIAYSKLNNTNTLRKPLIVVEGYDVSHIAPSLQYDYNVYDFIAAINEPFTSGYDFNHQLDDVAGYDLVFVNFNDGTDDIIRNAAVVQEVINQVNAHKVLDDRFGNIRQQNVVMGLSMGGIVARYALANMTKNFPSTPTETRLLITHDSPHRGANVPLGLQYLIRMMGGFQLFGYNVYDIYPDYDDAINVLNAPATKQLLLYRSVSANTYEANTFLDGDYRSMITFSSTDPQPSYQFVATSLGNECGHNLFNPGSTFINLGAGVSAGIDARILFFTVPIVSYKLAAQVEAYALPNTGSTNKIARLYTINNLKLFGFIDVFKQLYDNTAYAPGTQLPVDGVPGSNYPLLDVQALDQLTSLPVFNPISLYVEFPIGTFLGGYFGAYAYNEGVNFDFTFVPTASALDVSTLSTASLSDKYVNGTNQNYPSTSRSFIAQESVTSTSPALYNNVHIKFTARNSQWLYNEMEGLNNNLNCSSECFNPYFISGDNLFCSTSGSYFIPGLPRGATVTWSASPAALVTLSCTTCNTVSIARVNDGDFTLSAQITNACNGNSSITKVVHAGQPVLTSGTYVYNGSQNPLQFYTGSSSYNPLCVSQTTDVNTTFSGATSLAWSKISSSQTVAWTQNGNDLNFYLWGIGQTAVFNVQASNGCGNLSYNFGFQAVNCSGGGGGGCAKYSVTKINSSSLRVVQPDIPAPCRMINPIKQDSSSKKDAISLVKIYDLAGRLRLRQEFNHSKEAVVNTSTLMSGVYIIEIWDGDTVERQKVPILK